MGSLILIKLRSIYSLVISHMEAPLLSAIAAASTSSSSRLLPPRVTVAEVLGRCFLKCFVKRLNPVPNWSGTYLMVGSEYDGKISVDSPTFSRRMIERARPKPWLPLHAVANQLLSSVHSPLYYHLLQGRRGGGG